MYSIPAPHPAQGLGPPATSVPQALHISTSDTKPSVSTSPHDVQVRVWSAAGVTAATRSPFDQSQFVSIRVQNYYLPFLRIHLPDSTDDVRSSEQRHHNFRGSYQGRLALVPLPSLVFFDSKRWLRTLSSVS